MHQDRAGTRPHTGGEDRPQATLPTTWAGQFARQRAMGVPAMLVMDMVMRVAVPVMIMSMMVVVMVVMLVFIFTMMIVHFLFSIFLSRLR